MGSRGYVKSEQISTHEFEYEWIFPYSESKCCCFIRYESPAFCSIFNVPVYFRFKIDLTKWCGVLSENHTHHDFKVRAYLVKSSDVIPCKLEVSCETKLLEVENSLLASENVTSKSFDHGRLQCLSFTKYQCSSYVISGSVLTVKCRLKFLDSCLFPGTDLETSVSTVCQPNQSDLVQDLKNLYNNGFMSDVTIRTEDGTHQAHKLILAARSPVFQKMMEHDCIESKSNCITITDCDTETFEKFLKYLYTAEMEDKTFDTVMSLYSLADKYDVQGLRTACSEIILSKFDSDKMEDLLNCVCCILRLSYHHRDQKLKDSATRFIVNHFSEVGSREEWKEIMKHEHELTSEILVQVATALQKN